MPSIRKTKTASGATAVQVMYYSHRKVVVMKHVGSGKTPEEITALIESAQSWIKCETGQQTLFEKEALRTLLLANTQYIGMTHYFAYHVLHTLAQRIGFGSLNTQLLLDLADILICFIALALGKYIELQAGLSLQRIVDLLWSVTEAHLVDTITQERFSLNSEANEAEKTWLSYLMREVRSNLVFTN